MAGAAAPRYDLAMESAVVTPVVESPAERFPADVRAYQRIVRDQLATIATLESELAEARAEIERLRQVTRGEPRPRGLEKESASEREILRTIWRQVTAPPTTGSGSPTEHSLALPLRDRLWTALRRRAPRRDRID